MSRLLLLPELLNEHAEGEIRIFDLRIPESLAYFPGHFPDVPILPGVVQIHWAVHFAREKLGATLPFQHMEVIKFKDLIRPGQILQLHLRYQARTGKLQFAYRAGAMEFSSGRIYFHGNGI